MHITMADGLRGRLSDDWFLRGHHLFPIVTKHQLKSVTLMGLDRLLRQFHTEPGRWKCVWEILFYNKATGKIPGYLGGVQAHEDCETPLARTVSAYDDGLLGSAKDR